MTTPDEEDDELALAPKSAVLRLCIKFSQLLGNGYIPTECEGYACTCSYHEALLAVTKHLSAKDREMIFGATCSADCPFTHDERHVETPACATIPAAMSGDGPCSGAHHTFGDKR